MKIKPFIEFLNEEGEGDPAPAAASSPVDGSVTTSSDIATYPWPIGIPRGPGYDRPIIVNKSKKSKKSKKTKQHEDDQHLKEDLDLIKEFQTSDDNESKFKFLFRLINITVKKSETTANVQNFIDEIGLVRLPTASQKIGHIEVYSAQHGLQKSAAGVVNRVAPKPIIGWIYCPINQQDDIIYYALEIHKDPNDNRNILSLKDDEKKIIVFNPFKDKELFNKLVKSADVKRSRKKFQPTQDPMA